MVKEYAIFALKVWGAMLILNQVTAISAVVNKNYFAGTST